MNKHFSDSRYYLERAVEHATLGLNEVLESVRDELASLERTAVGRAREAVGSARATLSRSASDESSGDR